ncbi:MAG: beta-propeller domain-containing protein, partial [Actinomycetota bacterium]|nr:beta-propeller domain-containing protein [Actinomycetota bacterium]
SLTRPPGGTAAGPDDPLRIDADLISSLQAFDECDDLIAYLRTEGAKAVGPYGFDGGGRIAFASGGDVVADSARQAGAPTAGAAASANQESDTAATSAPKVAGTDFSGTNVQEEGVDEPDLVKTDGRRLVTIASGELRIVDLTGGEPRLASSLRLDDTAYLDGQLMLAGDRVLVLRAVQPQLGIPRPVPAPGIAEGDRAGIAAEQYVRPGPPQTVVTAVDIADTAKPRIVEEVTFDGDLVASRMVAGVARLVLRSGPPALPFLYPSGSEASVAVATDANKKVVAESRLEDWLPSFTVGNGGSGGRQRLSDCGDVQRPEVFSGIGMLSVVTVDAEDPRPGPAATVIGAGEIVYASAERLYVTSTAFTSCPPNANCAAAGDTDIHAFDIRDKVRTTYDASGRVKGHLLNSYSMSEHDGVLRVATTDDATRQSAVTTLRRDGATLAVAGTVGGLGKDERIYAVRFIGDRGYVVTFRQTDPLYVIDLADPAAPKVTGELKIPGYSAYLHPIGEHRLIGIGQDASETGRVQGTQVSLFDVADPTDPKRLANAVLPQSNSEAEFDPHAFLWWARTELVVVPVQDGRDGSSSAVGFTVGDVEVSELGRIRSRDRQPIRRSVVVGDRLLTLSEAGLQANDLATLAERSYLPY